MLEFLAILKTQQIGDVEKILAISQNIIYHLVIYEVGTPQEQRAIITNDEEMMKAIA